MQRRNTSQRQIVFESLAVLGHATTESLISYIKNNYDAISLATIYRNIGILLEEKRSDGFGCKIRMYWKPSNRRIFTLSVKRAVELKMSKPMA